MLALSDHVTLHGVLIQQEDSPPHTHTPRQALRRTRALGLQNLEPNALSYRRWGGGSVGEELAGQA